MDFNGAIILDVQNTFCYCLTVKLWQKNERMKNPLYCAKKEVHTVEEIENDWIFNFYLYG